MSFVYPQLFWAMIIPFAIFSFLILTNKEKIARIFDEKVLERLRADDALPLRVRNMMLLVAIFFMILALSRPVIEKGEKVVSIKGLSAMVALDISGSMRSRDIYPNRLEFSKKKLSQLFAAMPTDEIALGAFAHVTFMLAPFTSDKAMLAQIVDGVHEGYINMASTNFDALANLAVKMLADKEPKILIVASDGGDKKVLEGFTRTLKENSITLYTILVGTPKGAPVLDAKGKTVTTKSGSIAITQINKELGEIAQQTGGSYVVAAHGKRDMQALVAEIRAKFGGKKQGDIKVKVRREFFIYPLLISVVLLLLGLSSLPRRVESVARLHKEKS